MAYQFRNRVFEGGGVKELRTLVLWRSCSKKAFYHRFKDAGEHRQGQSMPLCLLSAIPPKRRGQS